MYLSLIILPLLGSIATGLFGRKLGVTGSQLITTSLVIITTILAIIAYLEVGLNSIPVSIHLFRWIDSESLIVYWGFHFDSLTASMLLPVLVVSSLVHVYSIGYMSHDPLWGVVGKRLNGGKLSNSGNLLKFLIPSCSWKTISGWTNYSGKVTSQKMSENEMDNRWSKSVILNNIIVKEQRVDGSNTGNSVLRYTLMGFERNYQLKILSKQLIEKNFSTLRSSSNSTDPWFWTGLIDAEGSFSIIIDKNKSIWKYVKPSLTISRETQIFVFIK